MTELTNTQIDQIIESAESSVHEDVIDMRVIKDNVKVDNNAPLEAGEGAIGDSGIIEATTGISKDEYDSLDEIDRIAKKFESVTADVSLLDIKDGATNPVNEEKVINTVASELKENLNLSNDGVLQLIDVMSMMKKDPKYPVYKNLPNEVKSVVTKLAMDNNADMSMLDEMSKMLLNEFMNSAGMEQSLVDLERALDESLKMPSVMDLYSDHIREVMEVKIPEVVEELKDTDPDKADMLNEVKRMFTLSYTYGLARDMYLADSTLRKAIRRHKTEFRRSIDLFNYQNDKSNFKMNDASHVPTALTDLLIESPNRDAAMYTEAGEPVPENITKILNMDIKPSDIEKFCVLIFRSARNFDPMAVDCAAYMYYLVRNIIALRHTREAKTAFAAELINNICNTITFIRDKESEFNASNMDKSKHAKKCASSKRK